MQSRMSSSSSNHIIQMDFIKKQDGKITVSEFTPRPGITFAAACNGSVLLSRLTGETPGEIFIADPETKRLQKLPPATHPPGCLFDHVFGLTNSVSTGEYKVIHYFICHSNNRLLGCEVITVGSSSMWKLQKLGRTQVNLCRQSRKIVFVRNSAYWMVTEGVQYFVVSFHMVIEMFCKIKLPKYSGETTELLDIGGVLSLVNPINARRNKFDIWVLKGYEWVKTKTISVDGVNRSVSPVASDEDGKVIIFGHTDQPVFYYAYDVELNRTVYLGVESEIKLPHIDGLVFKTLGKKTIQLARRKQQSLISRILGMFH